ncbi:MAG: hypothetical protein ACHQUC_03580 [Chlamydiales bacterium]
MSARASGYGYSVGSIDMKSYPDEQLIKIIKDAASRSVSGDHLLNLADMALTEISVRSFSKNNTEMIDTLIKKINAKYGVCLMSASIFFIEKHGIKWKYFDRKKVGVVHCHAGVDSRVVEIWMKWRGNSKDDSFEDYVSSLSDEDKREILESHVVYVSEDSTLKEEMYAISFTGSIIKIGGKTVENGEYMFVLDIENKKLLAHRKVKKPYQRFHHSSFFSGKPVSSAGQMKIRDGKLQAVWLGSGHYKPTEIQGKLLRSFLAHPSYLGNEGAEALSIEVDEKSWAR